MIGSSNGGTDRLKLITVWRRLQHAKCVANSWENRATWFISMVLCEGLNSVGEEGATNILIDSEGIKEKKKGGGGEATTSPFLLPTFFIYAST